MKKVHFLAIVLVLVFSGGILAEDDNDYMQGMQGMKGGMMWGQADMKVENTPNGIRIMVTSKDAGEVKMIQQRASEMEKMHAGMKAGKMQGMGQGGWKAPGMRHVEKKLDIAFKFLVVIWTLVILLLASTIVLVIKKIIAK